MKVDMLEFLKTGRFGLLVHGMQMEEVEKLLGPPQEVREWYSTEWVYGSLSLWTYRGLLEGVILHYRDTLGRESFKIPDFIELVGPKFSGRTTLKQFKALLGQEGIPYAEYGFDPTIKDSLRVTTLRVTTNPPPREVAASFIRKAGLLLDIGYAWDSVDQP